MGFFVFLLTPNDSRFTIHGINGIGFFVLYPLRLVLTIKNLRHTPCYLSAVVPQGGT